MKWFLLCLLLIIVIYTGFQAVRPGIFICHEGSVIADMQTITKAEVLYALTKGRGQFGDLATLGQAKMIDPALSLGEKNGYILEIKIEAVTGSKAMYEVTAKPQNGAEVRSESHSYYSNEKVGPEIFEMEGTEPPKATIEHRLPKVGLPMGVAH